MQVILKMTSLPPGSIIGPVFNVILTPAGTPSPLQVNLSQLLSPGGVTIIVPDVTTNIAVESTGLCSNLEELEIPCLNPIEFVFKSFFESTQSPSPEEFKNYLSSGFLINSCNLCDVECDEYVFGNIDIYLTYYHELESSNLCCHKIITSVETYLKYAEAVGLTS